MRSATAHYRVGQTASSPVRLMVSGFVLEAVYIVGFIHPYNLLAWLPTPAQDLGTMTGATAPSAAGYLVCVAVLMVGSYIGYREACRLSPGQAVWICFGFAGLFAATLMWIYPIDALDVFDYAMHGRTLAVLGSNPYVALPAWFPDDPFLPSVGWKTYPSVYGPLWSYVEGAIGWLSRDNLLEAVLLFKGLAALSSLACTWTAYRITKRWGSRPAASTIVLAGWNPLVVLMTGCGHNDLLMMAMFLAGVWLLVEDQPVVGLWLAGASTLIKAATLPLLLVLVVGQMFHSRRAGRSASRNVGLPLAALLVTGAALYAPLWAGLDNAGPLLLAGLFSQSPLGLLRELWIPSLGEQAAPESAAWLGDALLVAIVAIAMYRAHWAQRLAIQAVQDASFWIVFVALAWWQPWYVVWFGCLAAVDERRWARGLSWIAAAAGMLALFDRFYLTQHWLAVDMLIHQWHTVLLVFVPPIAWACVAPRLQTTAHRRDLPRITSLVSAHASDTKSPRGVAPAL